MHPAPSVILFTALSGLGFGLLFFLSLGIPEVAGARAFAFFFAGFAMAVGGLLFSTFHLGNPKNSLKAFTQWRSSWLSREAILSVATLIAVGLYAAALIFLNTRLVWLGQIGAVGAALTVFCTAMIYAQLASIPRWHHPLVPVLFMLYTLGGGVLWVAALSGIMVNVALVTMVVLGAVQVYYWRTGDEQFAKAGSTMGSATGLGALGKLRQFESPHTGSNFLLDEMVYQIGRKHGYKLRLLGASLGFVLPVFALAASYHPAIAGLGAVVALASHMVGLLICRWLFFAEAEHVVGLYYGAHSG